MVLAAGLGLSAQLPVTAPLLTDAYPITARARVFAIFGGAQSIATMAAPFVAGGIAALAGGGSGWRWPFLVLGLLAFPFALAAQRRQLRAQAFELGSGRRIGMCPSDRLRLG